MYPINLHDNLITVISYCIEILSVFKFVSQKVILPSWPPLPHPKFFEANA